MLRTVLLLSSATAALAGCSARAATAPAAMPVTLTTAAAPAGSARYAGPGTLAPQHVYRIAFEIPGRVVAVNADVGDRVAAGAVLAAIDRSDYAAQARAADARAVEAGANASKARNGARLQERIAADESVAAARAQLDRTLAAQRLAASNRLRYDALYASGDIAAVQHDQTEAGARDADAAVNAARAQLAQVQAQRALVHDGTRTEDLTASAADAAAARAAGELAQVTLRKTQIVAPAAAYVEQRTIEPGSDAQPGTSAFVLVDARDADVLVAVPEARLAGIVPGTPATVRLDGHAFVGNVTRVEPDPDAATRTAQVRVRTPGLHARSGAVVDVALGTTRSAGEASVALGAIVTDPRGRTHVLVYDAATTNAALRAVRVISGDGERAVVAGLAPGTRVVRGGAALVKPGAALRVVPE